MSNYPGRSGVYLPYYHYKGKSTHTHAYTHTRARTPKHTHAHKHTHTQFAHTHYTHTDPMEKYPVSILAGDNLSFPKKGVCKGS